MGNELLGITAKCEGNAECTFQGEDIFLVISITSEQDTEIGFPLAYLQKTGPIVRLIDTRTQKETYLRTRLADWDLKKALTPIRPGESAILEYVITSDELRQFGHPDVDLSAEITILAEVRVHGELVEVRATDTLHIVSEPNA